MSNASGAKSAGTNSSSSILRDALFAALIGAGISFPILVLKTDQDMSNRLVLIQRWWWMPLCAAIAFVAVLLRGLYVARKERSLVQDKADLIAPDDPGAKIAVAHPKGVPWAKIIGPLGIGFLLAFPSSRSPGAGYGGALKWIDNYGVQIMIYVMLGWGLNIVVGLAGLLDLGYVAFYAVGAYAYALLSTHYGLSFWICLPVAGILAAFWGILLGFPVLRLRGDYLAIVTLAFGEIIPRRADQLDGLLERQRRHFKHPESDLLRRPVHECR